MKQQIDKKRVEKVIDKHISDLDKEENYSLKGDKKICCQMELKLLKEELGLEKH